LLGCRLAEFYHNKSIAGGDSAYGVERALNGSGDMREIDRRLAASAGPHREDELALLIFFKISCGKKDCACISTVEAANRGRPSIY
jgi:hypothetical protein